MIKPYVPPQQDRTLGALETQTVQSKPYTEHYNVLMKMNLASSHWMPKYITQAARASAK